MSSPSPLPPLPRAARTAGRVFAWVLGALLIVGVVASAWIGVRTLMAVQHLGAVQREAAGATDALRDPSTAPALIADISADTSAARELTSDPIFRAAETLPWVGPQLDAIATVAAAADDVASDSLTPLAEVAGTFSIDALRPVDGRIDLTAFTSISAAATEGADGIADAAASVATLDDLPLLGPVRSAVDEVGGLLDTAAESTDALARATQLLPAMLGADGPRDYLVVFQNNAEWRSLGGIVGAMSVIHTDDGTMSLTAQASSSDFPRFAEPVLDLGADVTGIFGTQPVRWIQNVTQVPDFAIGGRLTQQMWTLQFGQTVDGVISLDPVALSYLLEATGPVDLPTGEQLTADNAVSLLLNEVYLRYERPADQDAFFASAAAAVFEKLASGDADPAALVQALGTAGDQRRLLMWSAHPEDQAVLDGTTLQGPLPFDDDTQRGFGVYLNDGTGSKMDFYADAETTLTWDTCSAAGGDDVTGDVTLTVTVTNNAPGDAATTLPDYITGAGRNGVDPGIAKTVGYLYLPQGAELREASMSDESGFGGGFHEGRQVMSFSVELAPGESATATLLVRLAEPGPGNAVAWITPTVDADAPTTVGARCDTP